MNRELIKKIDNLFEGITKSKQIHDAILYLEGKDFSYSKGHNKDLDSPLFMASVAKLFTTTCILKLNEQGLISLNDKLSKYLDKEVLDSLVVYKGIDYSYELTLKDLLFQVSGIADAIESGPNNVIKKAIKEGDFSVSFEEKLTLTKQANSRFVPTTGKAYYADFNFDLLGEIITKVTKKPLNKVFKEFIFEPLKLTKTYVPTKESDYIPDIYYRNEVLHRPKLLISLTAGGNAVTTARELMIFTKAFFGGTLFDKTIFKELAIYHKLQITMGGLNYGGGYMQIPLGGLTTMFMGKGELIGHSGSTGSFAYYYPEKELFIVGDMNQMNTPGLPIRLLVQIASVIGKKY